MKLFPRRGGPRRRVEHQKITEGFARFGFSEALAAQLRQEGRLRELRSRLGALEPEPEKARKALDPAVAERLALRIEEYARNAPERAREALAACLRAFRRDTGQPAIG